MYTTRADLRAQPRRHVRRYRLRPDWIRRTAEKIAARKLRAGMLHFAASAEYGRCAMMKPLPSLDGDMFGQVITAFMQNTRTRSVVLSAFEAANAIGSLVGWLRWSDVARRHRCTD